MEETCTFAIFTDTSANLPTQLLAKHHIHVLPFQYIINGKAHTCMDTERFDGASYYGAIRAGTQVTTSQITPQLYIDGLSSVLESGTDVLFVGMSSGISGSFHSAELAAGELRAMFPRRSIQLVDTLAASLGEGIPVLHAASYRAQGKSLAETAELLRADCKRICQIFTVDDLMHLRRGGRLSGVTALVGTVLHIKPLLKGNEQGEIVTFEKVRGRKNSIEALAKRYDALVERPESQIVGVAHADCPEDAARLCELLRQNRPPKEILLVDYEPVTGSHVGPGALALFFMGGEDVRSK